MYKWLTVIVVAFSAFPAHALDANERRAWKNEIQYLSKRHITYTWGAATDTNADCSGIIYRSLKHIRPEIRRTTALEMWKGHGGWVGREIKTDDADDLDLIWFTWSERRDRPFGHIGIVYIPEGGVYSIFSCEFH